MVVPDLAANYRTTFELHAAGVEIMRLNLQRRHPSESPEQITERLHRWLWAFDKEIPCHREVAWPRSSSS